MFHPVGSQPPSVYWRRRLVFFATLVVVLALVLITLRVVLAGSGGSPSAAPRTSGQPRSSTPQTSSPASPTGSSTGSSASTPASPTSSTTSRTAVTPKACAAGALSVQAASDKTSYQVGELLRLMLVVTNTGSVSCVEDLADPQVVLTVYNGESRVWGSHDCAILAGTKDRILVPDTPVKVTVVWSGQSSQPNAKHTTEGCAPRQQVGAGTYTLDATLAGTKGKTTQFTIG